MEILSSTELSIKDLTNLSNPASGDLLIIEDISEGTEGITKNISISQLSTKIASSIFNENLNFTNASNTFSGSFYGTQTTIPANFYNIIARNNVTVNNNLSVTGTSTLTGNTTISTGNMVVSNGNLTVSAGNTSLQSVSCGNITSTGTIEGTTIEGTTITATTGFVGDVDGDLTGDIYSPTEVLILDTGAGPASDSNFYGTSSYSTKSNLVQVNGVPTGGTTGQFLTKASDANYALTWSNAAGTSESEVKSIVSSSMDGLTNYFAKFDNANHITRSFGIYENVASTTIIYQSGYSVAMTNGDLVITNGELNVQNGSITGSDGIYTSNITVEETSSAVNINQITVYGNLYGNTTLELSASSNVTLSLNRGQTVNVVVINEGAHTISEWSASFDGGVSVSDKIYWSGSLVPTIQTGAMDLYTFKNINGKVFGSAIQNFE
jgi:hypothetical protein